MQIMSFLFNFISKHDFCIDFDTMPKRKKRTSKVSIYHSKIPSVVIISFVSIGLSVLFSHLSFLLLSSSVVLEILMA